jgi:putative transposase
VPAYGRWVGRIPRCNLPDGLSHLTSRGNRRQALFLVERDAGAYLDLLDYITPRVGWTCISYCLMPNHVHLLADAMQEQLSAAMRYVNGVYAQRFNREHGFRGHLLQGRFKAKPIADEGHLTEALRYIVMNPVRAGLCERPEQWPWSSYRAHLGLSSPRGFLDVERALRLFGRDDAKAREELARFVDLAPSAGAEWTESPGRWGQSRGQSPFEAPQPSQP